jgi:hypothetical protein
VTASDLDVVIGEEFPPYFVLPPISANMKKNLNLFFIYRPLVYNMQNTIQDNLLQ